MSRTPMYHFWRHLWQFEFIIIALTAGLAHDQPTTAITRHYTHDELTITNRAANDFPTPYYRPTTWFGELTPNFYMRYYHGNIFPRALKEYSDKYPPIYPRRCQGRKNVTILSGNITSARLHFADILSIGADYNFLQETKTTIHQQLKLSHDLRQVGFAATWGPPMDPRTIEGFQSTNDDAEQGGLAAFTRMPAKARPYKSTLQLYTKLWATKRFQLTTIRLGPKRHILVANCYAYTGGTPKAKVENNQLFEDIACILKAIGPTAVFLMGDLQHRATEAGPLKLLLTQGWHDLGASDKAGTHRTSPTYIAKKASTRIEFC